MSVQMFKGVAGGKNRGDVIEFPPEEKVLPALKIGVANNAEWKNEYLVSVDNVKTTKFDFGLGGDPLKKKWANNRYTAEGTATFYFRKMQGDVVLAPRELKFKMVFCDCLDDRGLPGLKVDSLSVV